MGLLWGGSSLFTAMEFALGVIIGAVSVAFSASGHGAGHDHPVRRVSGRDVGINSIVAIPGIIWVFEPVVGLLVWCTFMLAVYRLVPNRTYRVSEIWPGVVIAGTAMEILTLLWPLYARLSQSSRRMARSSPSFFVLASWLYFLAQFILLGAVANRMHAGEPDTRGLLGERFARRPKVAEASRTGGEVSRRGREV